MRLLILGGTGFTGTHVVRQLLLAGHEVTVFHRGRTPVDSPVRQVLGDRDRLSDHAAALRRLEPDVVVDMIAMTEAHGRDLVDIFRGAARWTVVVSSGDVYRAFGIFAGLEPGPVEPMPLTEDSPLRRAYYLARTPTSTSSDPLYEYEKILVERAVTSDPSLPCTILRLPMVYGPGDARHRLGPYVARMDAARPAILLDERLTPWRSPRGYVEDVAAAIVLAATNPRASGRTYNVAQPVAYTEAEWVAHIGRAAGWSGRIITVPAGRLPVPGNVAQDIIMDSTRIRTELGYSEPTPADLGLLKTIASERNHPMTETLDFTDEDKLLQEQQG